MLEIYRKVTAYDSLFENAEKYFGDDDGLGIPWNVRLKSQAVAESALCPSAFNPKSGAKGIAQFVLPTWKLVTGSERDEREIPEKAIPAMAQYMAYLTAQLNPMPGRLGIWKPARRHCADAARWPVALWAYNQGPGAVERRLKSILEQKGIDQIEDWAICLPFMPMESRNYVSKIVSLAQAVSGLPEPPGAVASPAEGGEDG
jgi:hypothetical protein